MADISDEAVLARTGKSWKQWFDLLDEAGATEMSPQEIAAWLSEYYGVGPWWQQMVAVVYQRARGMREKRQPPTGS